MGSHTLLKVVDKYSQFQCLYTNIYMLSQHALYFCIVWVDMGNENSFCLSAISFHNVPLYSIVQLDQNHRRKSFLNIIILHQQLHYVFLLYVCLYGSLYHLLYFSILYFSLFVVVKFSIIYIKKARNIGMHVVNTIIKKIDLFMHFLCFFFTICSPYNRAPHNG